MDYFKELSPNLINEDTLKNIIKQHENNEIPNKLNKFINDYFYYLLFFLGLIVFLFYRYNFIKKKRNKI